MFKIPNIFPLLLFVLLSIFSNIKLNNIDDSASPYLKPILTIARLDTLDFTFTTISLFFKVTSNKIISLLGKLNSFGMLKRLC